jgi:hypothetical protein
MWERWHVKVDVLLVVMEKQVIQWMWETRISKIAVLQVVLEVVSVQ